MFIVGNSNLNSEIMDLLYYTELCIADCLQSALLNSASLHVCRVRYQTLHRCLSAECVTDIDIIFVSHYYIFSMNFVLQTYNLQIDLNHYGSFNF